LYVVLIIVPTRIPTKSCFRDVIARRFYFIGFSSGARRGMPAQQYQDDQRLQDHDDIAQHWIEWSHIPGLGSKTKTTD